MLQEVAAVPQATLLKLNSDQAAVAAIVEASRPRGRAALK